MTKMAAMHEASMTQVLQCMYKSDPVMTLAYFTARSTGRLGKLLKCHLKGILQEMSSRTEN